VATIPGSSEVLYRRGAGAWERKGLSEVPQAQLGAK
jgi:hypothetical protein